MCPDLKVQAALANVEEEIKAAEENSEFFDQADKVFKKFGERLKATHKCPLCERDMGDKLKSLTDKVSKRLGFVETYSPY